MLILTDGKEWSFYLPTEQGRFDERQFYKLNLLECSLIDCVDTFCDFLHRKAIISGSAEEKAREVLKSKQKDIEIENTLPKAWKKLLEEPDGLLRDLLEDEVQNICGHKPGRDILEKFLSSKSQVYQSESILQSNVSSPKQTSHVFHERDVKSHRNVKSGKIVVIRYKGENHKERNMIRTLWKTIMLFAEEDQNFLPRLKLKTETARRNLVSQDKSDIYKSSPHLESTVPPMPLISGWWMGRVLSGGLIEKYIKISCEVAGVLFGRDFEILYE